MNNTVYSMDQSQIQIRVNNFVRSVYNWMAMGLGLTAVVAYFVASDPALFAIAQKGFFLFAIGELALVFILSARIGRMQAGTATGMFLLYALLNGVTFSYIFAIYTQTLIASTFFICAITFGALSVYGLQRMPVTLYVGQWERLFDFGDKVREFMAEHASEFSRKGE